MLRVSPITSNRRPPGVRSLPSSSNSRCPNTPPASARWPSACSSPPRTRAGCSSPDRNSLVSPSGDSSPSSVWTSHAVRHTGPVHDELLISKFRSGNRSGSPTHTGQYKNGTEPARAVSPRASTALPVVPSRRVYPVDRHRLHNDMCGRAQPRVRHHHLVARNCSADSCRSAPGPHIQRHPQPLVVGPEHRVDDQRPVVRHRNTPAAARRTARPSPAHRPRGRSPPGPPA